MTSINQPATPPVTEIQQIATTSAYISTDTDIDTKLLVQVYYDQGNGDLLLEKHPDNEPCLYAETFRVPAWAVDFVLTHAQTLRPES